MKITKKSLQTLFIWLVLFACLPIVNADHVLKVIYPDPGDGFAYAHSYRIDSGQLTLGSISSTFYAGDGQFLLEYLTLWDDIKVKFEFTNQKCDTLYFEISSINSVTVKAYYTDGTYSSKFILIPSGNPNSLSLQSSKYLDYVYIDSGHSFGAWTGIDLLKAEIC
ncbi:hypothetical protein NEF87_002043 [Candidatus Lokiarchaeum ossiferum]|uniref:Uncharacterized protein n=1 Tax=Candidatus Lokiarchaeum ossiferum TaxID=2951803 RepID=A0ABY6HQH6_9ARCH|nr:hypothetical protein NEF87_002043 [Candidatus Lokiarchaeum sp. B-35]